jgi:hypothetical protein
MNNFNYVLKKKQKAKNTEHRMVSTIISKKGDCPSCFNKGHRIWIRSNSTPKACSRVENCPPLTTFLVNVGSQHTLKSRIRHL